MFGKKHHEIPRFSDDAAAANPEDTLYSIPSPDGKGRLFVTPQEHQEVLQQNPDMRQAAIDQARYTADTVGIGATAARAASGESAAFIEDDVSRTHSAAEIKEILAEAKRISDQQQLEQFGPHDN